MKKKYQKPTISVHHVQPTGILAGSSEFPSDNIHSEDNQVPVSDDEIPPGSALSRRSRWIDDW